MIRNSILTLCSLAFSVLALAESPVISEIADQRAIQGETYTFQPTLGQGDLAYWTKTYGPDDVVVHPVRGEVTWAIPDGLPSESFHIGVKVSNNDGEHEETWIVTVGDGEVLYIGPNEETKTLKDGMSAISAGDTLVMKNGNWDHDNQDNTIPGNEKKGQKLPSGSESAFTTLMAEDPGQVVMDGQNEVPLISIFGSTKHPDFELNNNGWDGVTDYIAIKGLVLLNSDGSAIRVDYSKFVKLIDIGVGPSSINSGSNANLYIYRSQYVLLEGIYAWGHGRYKIQFKDSSEGVVRRSVARIDDYIGGEPIGGFISYCSKNMLFQNNILIDSDHSNYWGDHEEIINAFGVPATNCEAYPEFNEFNRNLGLNIHMGLMNTDARQNSTPTLWEDLVGWDLKPARHSGGGGGVAPILSGVGATVTNRMTLGEVNSEGSYFMYSREQDSTIKNSVFYRVGWDESEVVDQGGLIRRTAKDFYFESNDLFEFTGGLTDADTNINSITKSNTLSIDPEIKYLPMLPRDSILRESANDGSRVGAELMTMLGKSGTFYGQDGYDIETNKPMWPFPGEKVIHDHFSAFSHSGVDRNGESEGINGARGFAVEDQSLTNYVWGYLGNTVPPFDVVALPGSNQIKLLWSASAPVEQENIEAYKVYLVENGVKELKGEVPSDIRVFDVTGLENGVPLDLVVTAVNPDGKESDYAYVVSTQAIQKPRPKPPVLSVE